MTKYKSVPDRKSDKNLLKFPIENLKANQAYLLAKLLPAEKEEAQWLGKIGSAESLKQEIEAGSCLVIKNQNEIESYMIYRLAAEVCDVVLIFSATTARRKGHGRRLICSLFDKFQDVREVWVDVHEKNHLALAFYTRLGFRKVGLRKRYYTDGKSAILLSLQRDHINACND